MATNNLPKDLEHRFIKFNPEQRASAKGRTLSGYAALYNSRSQDLGGFIEIIAPGAFDASLASDDEISAFVNHDGYDIRSILGRRSNGTLRLTSDSTGLPFEIDCPNTSTGNDVTELVGRGDVYGMSFGFYVEKDEFAYVDGITIRTLIQVKLIEISVVTEPAYASTSVSVRAMNTIQRSTKKESVKLSMNDRDTERLRLRRLP